MPNEHNFLIRRETSKYLYKECIYCLVQLKLTLNISSSLLVTYLNDPVYANHETLDGWSPTQPPCHPNELLSLARRYMVKKSEREEASNTN